MAEPTPWRRQTTGNQMPGDYVDGAPGGGPPPPPPPPLALGAVPAVRLKAEINERRPEPPACVQNAMMTKDKKPFTYTPGGLDLSQIRSPRMARRLTRNANAEGVDGNRPPGGPPQQYAPLPPSALAAMQPQLPVQVFPTNGAPPAPMPPPPPPPPGLGAPPPPAMPSQAIAKAPSPPNSNSQASFQRPDIKIPENPMGLLRKTGGPYRTQEAPPMQSPVPQPTNQQQPSYQPVSQQQPSYQHVQSPAPQPMSQPIYKPVQPPTPPVIHSPAQQVIQQPIYQPRPPAPASPEQKHEPRAQIGSIYIPPLNAEELQKTPGSQKSDSPGSPLDTLKKAPTPWLTGNRSKQQMPIKEPAWARSPVESNNAPSHVVTCSPQEHPNQFNLTPEQEAEVCQNQQIMREQHNLYLAQVQQQRMLQQQQQMQQHQLQQQQYRQQQKLQNVRIIPIQIEGQSNASPMSPTNTGPTDMFGAPVQSPTFRILERVTSRDEEIHSQPAIDHPPSVGHSFPMEQMRRQMTDGDRNLMNRLRSQVDEDCFLHNEVDPRYRGSAIPSRAFRMLQSMTGAADASGDFTSAPRAVVNRGPHPQGGANGNSPRTPDGEGALPPSEQTVQEPRKYTGSAIPSRSFQMLQAMVAPENCANGTETDENNSSYPYEQTPYPYGYDPSYPPPYWHDPYWAYYQQDPNAYTDAEVTPPTDNGRQTPQVEQNVDLASMQMSEEEYYAQMQYYDPYYAYYAYYGYYPPPPPMAHPYSPHAFYPSAETDDYSSNDEMSYYGARFPHGQTSCGHQSVPTIQVTPSDAQVANSVENKLTKSNSQKNGLQAVRSVSDIQVYNENELVTSATEGEEDSSESDGDEDDDNDSEGTEDGENDSDHLPHQLSVIFEENEISDIERRKREASIATTISEDDSSTTIGNGRCDTDDSCDEQDPGEATVTVRLPLKLKFGMSENGKEEVTGVIVGDSEMHPNCSPDTSISVTLNINPPDNRKTPLHERPMRSPFCRQNSDETIENYETAEESDEQDNSPADGDEEADTDFWDEVNKSVQSDDDEKNITKHIIENDVESDESSDDESDEENDCKFVAKSSQAENLIVIDTKETNEDEEEDNEEDEDDEDSSDEDNSDGQDADDFKLEKVLRDAFASDAVKERVRALREAGKVHIGGDGKEEVVSVRQRIMAIENGSGTGPSASRSSSAKGCDFSEEDGDSGVTSDVSRDTESDFSERLKKRYQRASTHSRLFQLLQDECAKSDDEDDEDEEADKNLELRKKQLTLPLSSSEPESFASSGICSPSSPTWLARELVNGLLGGKQGKKYKALPLERLYAAAQRILQEDALSNTSEDGSPLESYASDYRSYYSSWDDAGSKCSSLKRRIARCPRVKSEKNVPARVAEEDIQEDCPNRSRSSSPCKQLATSAS